MKFREPPAIFQLANLFPRIIGQLGCCLIIIIVLVPTDFNGSTLSTVIRMKPVVLVVWCSRPHTEL